MFSALYYKRYSIIVLAIALALPFFVTAAGFELSWRDSETGGGTSCSPPQDHLSKSSAAAVDSGGYVYVTCKGQGAVRVVKWFPSGQTPVWDRTITPDGITSSPIDIAVDTSSNVYISYRPGVGMTRKFSSFGIEVVDSNWPKTIGDGSLTIDSSGFIYISTINTFGAFIHKYDAAGNLIQNNFATGFLSYLRDIAVDSSGRVYALSSEVIGTSRAASVVRMLPNGSLDVSWGAAGKAQYLAASLFPNAMAVADNGSVYVTGATTCCGFWNGMTIKFNSNGSSATHHQVDRVDLLATSLRTRDVAVDANNNVYVVGYGSAYPYANFSTVLFKYNSNLQLQEDILYRAADILPGTTGGEVLMSEAIAFNRFQANNENQFYISGYAGKSGGALHGPFAAGYRSDTPPSTPTNIRITAGVGANCRSLQVSWNANSELDIRSYRIYSDSGSGMALVATVPSSQTSYSDSNLNPAITYSYQVEAIDITGNVSPRSAVASAKPNECPDTTPPNVPTGVSAVRASCTEINIRWNASSDNAGGSGLKGYNVYRNGTKITPAPIAGTSYPDSGLTPDTTFSYQITAVDNANNESARSNVASATTTCAPLPPVGDIAPPTTPSITSVSNSTCGRLRIAWTASTDNVAVAGYNVYRNGGAVPLNGSLIAGTSYVDIPVTPGTSYSYRVRAVDTSNNVSGLSNPVYGTPVACPDTTPPIPSPNVDLSLGAGAEERCNTIDVSWTASNDPESGIARYDLWRRVGGVGAFNLHRTFLSGSGEFITRAFVDSPLSASTLYEYVVRAVNGAGLWADSSLAGTTTVSCPGPVGSDNFTLSANPILLTATVIGQSSALATTSATFITVIPQPGLPAGVQVTLTLDKLSSHAVAQNLLSRFIRLGTIIPEVTLTFTNPSAPQSVVFRLGVPHNTALGTYEPIVIRAKDTDKTTNVKLRVDPPGGTGER